MLRFISVYHLHTLGIVISVAFSSDIDKHLHQQIYCYVLILLIYICMHAVVSKRGADFRLGREGGSHRLLDIYWQDGCEEQGKEGRYVGWRRERKEE